MTNTTKTQTMPAATLETIRTMLKADAEAATAQWPQYRGRFDHLVVGKVQRTIKTKLGVAFQAGELVLFENAPHAFEDSAVRGRFVTAWSVTNKCHTSIKASDIVAVLAA